MVFNSLTFVLALFLWLIVYYVLPQRLRLVATLLASMAFVYCFSLYHLLFVMGVAASSYLFAVQAKKYKWFPTVGVIFNISLLFLFKYLNFFASSFFTFSHPQETFDAIDIIVPVGISYYTFKSISYLIDVKNERIAAETNLLHLLVYFLFFPMFMQGPVERARNFLPQLKKAQEFSWASFQTGLELFLFGMFKKVVIADRLGAHAEDILSNRNAFGSAGVALAVVCYALQIYADFGGYTNMALGISRMMGFSLMENFNRPYFSRNITEFWRRWHISFSTWLNEYLFNIISFNRRNWGIYGVIYAAMITFIISGLWHGANWTFIVWGMLHGIAIAYEALTKSVRKKWAKKINTFWYDTVSVMLTFLFVCGGLIFFRANSISEAWAIISRIAAGAAGRIASNDFDARYNLAIGLFFAAAFMVYEKYRDSLKVAAWYNQKTYAFKFTSYAMVLLLIALFGMYTNPSVFLYFKF